MVQNIVLYVGTYTNSISHVPESNGEGIHQFRLNQTSGELTELGVMRGIDNPSFIAIDHQQKYLYAGTELAPPHLGTVTAFAIDATTGALQHLNQQSAMGSATAYLAVDYDNRYVFVANYASQQSIAMLPIEEDGKLAPASDTHQHSQEAKGTVPSRQDTSHAHCIVPSPDNRFVLVCDLGLDKVMLYQLDYENQSLVPHEPYDFDTQAGSGPRHLVFHPSQNIVYIAQELDSKVAVLAFDPSAGLLEHMQTVPTLPPSYAGSNSASDIHVSADGRFVYTANRGHDSIAIYEVDQQSGQLTPIGHQQTYGKTPRGFTVDPSGQFLLVGNQDSHEIISFRINQTSGLLKQVATTACPTPVCLKMIVLDN